MKPQVAEIPANGAAHRDAPVRRACFMGRNKFVSLHPDKHDIYIGLWQKNTTPPWFSTLTELF